MKWIFLSLIGVVSATAMSIGQQIFKADAIPMLFWLRLTSFIILCAVSFFVTLPDAPTFYLMSALYGLLIVYLDIANFKYIGELGAAVAVRLSTIASIPSFFLWVLIDGSTQRLYLDHPMTSLMILCVVCMAAFFAGRLRHCQVTVGALKRLWPVMVHGTIGPIFAKLVVLDNPDHLGGIIAYIMTICTVSMAILLIFMSRDKDRFRPLMQNIKNRKAGFVLALCSVMMIISTYLAYEQVQNPSYVAVIMMTIPVVVSVYNRVVGYKDDSHKWAGFGLVSCAILIAVLKL